MDKFTTIFLIIWLICAIALGFIIKEIQSNKNETPTIEGNIE